jgi:hypothetical protein
VKHHQQKKHKKSFGVPSMVEDSDNSIFVILGELLLKLNKCIGITKVKKEILLLMISDVVFKFHKPTKRLEH